MRKYFANYNLKISLKNIFLLLAVCGIGIANTAYAHEAYVLPQNYFWQVTDSISQPTGLTPLTNPQNFNTGVTIAVFVLLALCVNFFLRRTKFFQKIGKKIEQYSDIGPVLVRIAIAVSFFRAATVHSLFGPELPFSNIIHADLVSPLLIVSALFILFGFLTEIGALLGLIAFTFAFASHGLYMLTYCMYVGELLVLLLFGVSRYSLDAIFFPNLVTRFILTFAKSKRFNLSHTAGMPRKMVGRICFKVVNNKSCRSFDPCLSLERFSIALFYFC